MGFSVLLNDRRMKKLNLLILSTWKKDWDMENVKSPPITSFVINRLLERGHKITWIAPGEEPFEKGNLKVLNTSLLLSPPGISLLGSLLYPFVFKKSVKIFIRSVGNIDINRFDGIVAYGREAVFSADIISKKFEIPYIARIHGLNDFRFFINSWVSFFTHYPEKHYPLLSPRLFVVDDDGTFPVQVFKKLGIKNYIVLPHSAERSKKQKREARKRLKIYNSDIIIGYVGNFSPLKGTQFLKFIIPGIINKCKPYKIRFLIIGDGKLRNIVKEVLQKHPKEVIWFGKIPHHQVVDIYPAMDFLLHLVSYSSCTLPLIEALINDVIPITIKMDDTLPYPLEDNALIAVSPKEVKKIPEVLCRTVKNKKLFLWRKRIKGIKRKIIKFKKRIEWEVRIIEESFC